MPVFRPRNRIEIMRQMVARAVARSRLSGLTQNSNVFHLIAAFATELAEAYFQLARLRDVFSIDKATGSDLDERAKEIQPGTIRRRTALYATTPLRVTRNTTAGTLPIPIGSIFAALDTNGQEIRFKTTANGSITPGNTVSADIAAVAISPGARANVVAGSVTRLITRIPSVIGVTNPQDVLNGRDRENDTSFRARLKDYIASLPRGTVRAIESAARLVRTVTNQFVLFSRIVEPLPPNGTITLYIDDGTGNVESYDSSLLTTPEIVVASAAGGEQDLQLGQWPIRDDGSFVLEMNATPLVRNTDYWLDPTRGRVRLATPLAALDEVTAEYRFYTGLIQAVGRVIAGVRGVRELPGYAAGGITCFVYSATRVLQTISANITVAADFDQATVIANTKTAIQTYINGLGIGENVIVAELYAVIMGVDGVTDVVISSPTANQVILSHQVARTSAADITVT
jgi:uncharacterized phage protein gp47/JayE